MIYQPSSYRRLSECHPDLQRVIIAAAEEKDFVVTCGHRGEEDQNIAFATGRSKVRWPNGKHNSRPSKAVDLAPWPIDWADLGRFDKLGLHVLEVAGRLGVEVSWGGDWVRFKDRPHIELKGSSGG